MKQNKILLAELEKHRKFSRKTRRSKLEIYYDILNLIEMQNSKILPTHIQIATKTSYDKFINYLDELERGKLIQRYPLIITHQGKNFLADYEKLMRYLPKKERK